MLRPLDEALIDFEKTYREIYKQPLYQHEQYTKRQLIYNYAAVGSIFINQTILKQAEQSDQQDPEVDLQKIIRQWNNPAVKIQDISAHNNKISQSNQKMHFQYEDNEDDRNFKKDIQVLKKQKVVIKTRMQRNVTFRKELQVLFKSRNVSMLSVQSMRSHFADLKPLISFNSRFRSRKDKDYEKYSDRNDKYSDRIKSEDQIDSHRRPYQNNSQQRKYTTYYSNRPQYPNGGDPYNQSKYASQPKEHYSQNSDNINTHSYYGGHSYRQNVQYNQKYSQSNQGQFVSGYNNQNYQGNYDSRRPSYLQANQQGNLYSNDSSIQPSLQGANKLQTSQSKNLNDVYKGY